MTPNLVTVEHECLHTCDIVPAGTETRLWCDHKSLMWWIWAAVLIETKPEKQKAIDERLDLTVTDDEQARH